MQENGAYDWQHMKTALQDFAKKKVTEKEDQAEMKSMRDEIMAQARREAEEFAQMVRQQAVAEARAELMRSMASTAEPTLPNTTAAAPQHGDVAMG